MFQIIRREITAGNGQLVLIPLFRSMFQIADIAREAVPEDFWS